MNTMNVDWRAVVVILLVLLFIFSRNPAVDVVLLTVGAAWALQSGLGPWRGGRSPLGSTKVTYWRGQKIVTKQPPRARLRSVGGLQLTVSVLYIVLGLGMAYAAIVSFLRLVGVGLL